MISLHIIKKILVLEMKKYKISYTVLQKRNIVCNSFSFALSATSSPPSLQKSSCFSQMKRTFYSKSKNLIFTINLLSNIIFFDYTNGCNIFTIAMFQNIKYPSLHPLRYNTYAYTTEEHTFTILSI